MKKNIRFYKKFFQRFPFYGKNFKRFKQKVQRETRHAARNVLLTEIISNF